MTSITTYIDTNGVMAHPEGAKTITRAALVAVLWTFIDIFGREPMLKRRDFGHREFYSPSDLDTWDLALALQIMLDTLAVCRDEDKRISWLRQCLYDLLGDMDSPQTVYFQGYPFYI
ncbi:hypothetical protein [Massilia horti]|uniref:Uncharacterized protein n=1 Tax=Massilia horti TaxID=2562153 RepID=A0A4Y9T285_9BURK|nr:hypothetical protein [Massilia horti]TFW33596.1 hypothetical protein E4O92_06275 [Massilia horti]